LGTMISPYEEAIKHQEKNLEDLRNLSHRLEELPRNLHEYGLVSIFKNKPAICSIIIDVFYFESINCLAKAEFSVLYPCEALPHK